MALSSGVVVGLELATAYLPLAIKAAGVVKAWINLMNAKRQEDIELAQEDLDNKIVNLSLVLERIRVNSDRLTAKWQEARDKERTT